MQIRNFSERDKAAVIELWQICELTRPWNNPERDIERKLAVNDGGFWVVEEGSKLIASVMFGYDGHRGTVNYLAVHPDYQGQSIGKTLMQKVEETLSAQGCPKLNLMVRSENSDVINFYQSLGYELNMVAVLGKRLIVDD